MHIYCRRKLVVQLSIVRGRNLLQLEIYISIYLYSLLSNYNNLYECDLRACEIVDATNYITRITLIQIAST
jgi:hypothetical protein